MTNGESYAASKASPSPYAGKNAKGPPAQDIAKQPEDQGSPLAGKYRVVDASVGTCIDVRNQLGVAAEVFLARNELLWAFPCVYALVTHEVLEAYNQGAFQGEVVVLRWV